MSRTSNTPSPRAGARRPAIAPDEAGTKPASSRRNIRSDRLELRLTPEDKKLVAQAAELHGMKSSEYVLKVLRRASSRTMEKVRSLRLSRRDQITLIEALLDPRPRKPGARLSKAKQRYDKLIEKR